MILHRAPVESALPPLARLWRLLAHPLLLIVLTALMFVAFAAHSWLPQLPTALAGDAIAASTWLAKTAADYPAGNILQALGLFDLAHNLALRILLPLLAAALLVRIMSRLHVAWTTRNLTPPEGVLPLINAFDIELEPTAEPEAWQAVCAEACERSAHDVGGEEESGGNWYGDHAQRFTWFAAFIELGLILALLALLLNLRAGWQMDALNLAPGDTIRLTPFSAQTIGLDPNAETLRLCCEPERSTPLENGDIRAGGIRISQQQLGPALHISVNEGGEALPIQAIEESGAIATELIVRFPQPRTERGIAIPDHSLVLRLVNTGPQQFSIQAIDIDSNVLMNEVIDADITLALEQLEVQLQPTHFVTLTVTSRPWTWLLLPGLLLLLIGLLVRWLRPYFRLGVLYGPGGIAIRWQGQGRAKLPVEISKLFEVSSP